MNTVLPARPKAHTSLRKVQRLIGAYAALSVLTVVAVVLLRNHQSLVTSVVWGRTVAVAALSLITVAIARRAANGSARALLRLRIITPIMLAAIVIFVVLPGALPIWVRIEQAVCGVLVAAVVALVHGRGVRRGW